MADNNKLREVESVLDGKNPFLDEEGYPTEEVLVRVTKWPIHSAGDCKTLLQFVERLWRYESYFSYGVDEEGKKIALVSTAGWSGNESLISALEENHMFWILAWVQSRRGGHYIFDVGE